MKTVTEISQSRFYTWAKNAGIKPETEDLDQLRAFLAEVRGYRPEIIASVSSATERMAEGGIKVFIEHAPIPKFRIVLPLAHPYEFQQKGLSHQDTIKSWGRKIFGMANHLGIKIDTACIDPSRLFYAARHAAGRPFEVHLIGGELLDITKVAERDSSISLIRSRRPDRSWQAASATRRTATPSPASICGRGTGRAATASKRRRRSRIMPRRSSFATTTCPTASSSSSAPSTTVTQIRATILTRPAW